MASGNAAGFRRVCQLKPIVVKESLIKGNKFIRWDEDSNVGVPVTLRVDPKGHFVYWRNQNKEVDCLELSAVRDTRTGRYAKVPKEGKLKDTCTMGSPDVSLEDKTLTIVYGTDFVNTQFINFCTNKEAIAKEWVEEVFDMAYNMLALNASPLQYWEKMHSKLIITSPIEGKVPVKHILKMFASNKEDRKKVDHALQAAGLPAGKNDVIPVSRLTFDDFFIFYSRLTHRAEIDKIFQELGAKNKPYLTVEQFTKFQNTEQRDPRLNEVLFPLWTQAKAQELIDDYEPNKPFGKKGHISIEGFTKYLMSFDNYIVPAENYELNEDMDQPLAHYFINSSHNTYLTGHQLTGKSSVEIYRQVLLAGCRCVELDCWDGKAPEEEPVITHGYTMCTEVLFKDVIEAIAESAFKTSVFPVILSFENHCSPKQQAKMAHYCRTIFGEMLLVDNLEDYPLKSGIPLPSPKALSMKIIVKNKKKKDVPEKNRKRTGSKSAVSSGTDRNGTNGGTGNGNAVSDVVANGSVDGSKNDEGEKAKENASVQDSEISSRAETNTKSDAPVPGGTKGGSSAQEKFSNSEKMDTIDEDYESDSDDEREGLSKEEQKARLREKREKGTAGQEVEAGAEMSALVNYVTPVHFHAFETSEKKNRCYEISSFVESTALLHVKGQPVEFVNYNKRQLSRIYPKGTRIDSVNFMPQVFWNVGCQLVALNFQSPDLAMQLNMGIFEYNGRCGYIIKPDFMRRAGRHFDPFAESTVDGIVAGTVSVKVISGQFVSDKRVSTYVEVDMYGLPTDTVRKRFRTKTVQGNGINPMYDEEPFVFKKVVLPNLAMLRIAVVEENGKLIGHRILPLEGIRPGYRHISLRNESNQPLTLPTLFIHISVKDYVPDTLTDFAAALANPIAYQNMVEKRERQLKGLTEDFEGNEDTDQLDQFGRMKIPTPSNGVESNGAEGMPGGKSPLEVSRSNESTGNQGYIKSNGDNSGQRNVPHLAARQSTGLAKTAMIRKESNMSVFSYSSESSSGGVLRSSSIANTRLLMAKNSIAEEDLQRTKSAPMLGQATEIEAAEVDDIKDNKKYQKIVAKQQKELEKIIKKHEKAQSKLKKSLTLRMEKLLTRHLKSHNKLKRRHTKSVKNVNRRKKGDPTMLKTENDQQMNGLLREHEQEVNELRELNAETLLAMYRDHYRIEKEMKERHVPLKYELLRNIMVSTHDAQLRELDKYHKREESELQKRMYVQNREEMRTLNKRIKNKQELQRLKREFQQKHITQAVTARKTLSEFQERKRKQLENKMMTLQEKLTHEENLMIKECGEEFEKRCANLDKEALKEGEDAEAKTKENQIRKEVSATIAEDTDKKFADSGEQTALSDDEEKETGNTVTCTVQQHSYTKDEEQQTEASMDTGATGVQAIGHGKAAYRMSGSSIPGDMDKIEVLPM
ncbi:1-phosphatidylinositol 4,5-bisphosphate phosphodiesterase beta-1-like isoform X2 [Ptychodera flava]|uniref:1-phosphatidylinositol 4,5-bisphosphate phosphodiesterase beta-1-like isoform X2 n=1 Tax=Ptychodera flava TaxID=63121 RepID=UPI00396A1BBB